MNDLVHLILNSWNTVSWPELALLVIACALILFSKLIVSKVTHTAATSPKLALKVKVFRAINFLIIFIVLLNHFVFFSDSPSVAQKLLGGLMVMFSAFWTMTIAHYLIRRKYGKAREFNGETRISDTYNSRLLSLLTTILIIIVSLIGIIQVIGFSSLLEAGGMIGFFGVMLALTQASWAPDIISGLIILNSGLVDEGDVIELEDENIIATVFRTKLFHTELLDMINNHRIMLNNAKLRNMTIQNLSKFASARGLREVLKFKIGYATPADDVTALFELAHAKALESKTIAIEEGHPLDIRIVDTGDYAVEWAVYYYTKDVRNLIKTRQFFRELILKESINQNISLATPDLHVLEQQSHTVAPILAEQISKPLQTHT